MASLVDIDLFVHRLKQPSGTNILVCLHGFLGSGLDFAAVTGHLQDEKYGILAPDLPGFGRSDLPAENKTGTGLDSLTFDHYADEVYTWLRSLRQKIYLTGYSMGGRVALACVIRDQQQKQTCIRRLVLIGAHTGLPADQRTGRLAMERSRADGVERDGLSAFVDYWQGLPLMLGQQQHMLCKEYDEMLARKKAHKTESVSRVLRTTGLGSMPDLSQAIANRHCPVHLVYGQQDHKFATLYQKILAASGQYHAGSVTRAHTVQPARPALTLDEVPASGHAPHLEVPQALAGILHNRLQ